MQTIPLKIQTLKSLRVHVIFKANRMLFDLFPFE